MDIAFDLALIFTIVGLIITLLSLIDFLIEKHTCQACRGIKKWRSQYCNFCTIDMEIWL